MEDETLELTWYHVEGVTDTIHLSGVPRIRIVSARSNPLTSITTERTL
jgi:hypothetical protein